MKYYLRLIKNKQWLTLLILFLWGSIGVFCTVFNLIGVINNGNGWNESYNPAISTDAVTGFLSMTDAGMILVGLICMWAGFILFPRCAKMSQDDSDYRIEFEGDKVHIWFKKNEWIADREKIEPTDLFFRDKNKKFVSITRGYQVYNYYHLKYQQ